MRMPILRPFVGSLLPGAPLASANSQQGSGSFASHLIDRPIEVIDQSHLSPQDARQEIERTLQGHGALVSRLWKTDWQVGELATQVLPHQFENNQDPSSQLQGALFLFPHSDTDHYNHVNPFRILAEGKKKTTRRTGKKSQRTPTIAVRQNAHPSWARNASALKATVKYILATYLDGDPARISTSATFMHAQFRLQDGTTIRGHHIVSATALREKPQIVKIADAVKALGGKSAIIKLLKEKYLGISAAQYPWASTPKKLKATLEYIVEKYLDGDPNRISTGAFLQQQYCLKNGTTVSGQQIIRATVRLEKPEARKIKESLRTLGGWSAVITILKENYLGISAARYPWASTPERLKEIVEYVLETYLGGDPDRITIHDKFMRRQYRLKDGTTVSGEKILIATALFERPQRQITRNAVKELGGFSAAKGILKEKYLGISTARYHWASTPEVLKATIQYIFETCLDGDPKKLTASSKFRRTSFQLKDGTLVTGLQIIHTIARMENPGVSVVQAISDLGGSAAVVEIIKKKYLVISADRYPWASSPERLKATIQYIFENCLGRDPTRISVQVSCYDIFNGRL